MCVVKPKCRFCGGDRIVRDEEDLVAHCLHQCRSRGRYYVGADRFEPLHERSQVGTLIFDEIDSGVGGAVADTVGRLMQRLGRDRQVMAVTHLAQVAACAHQHLVVAKAVHEGQTTSDIREVRDDVRTTEIARMLGGQITETSRAHAQAMLATARAQEAQDAQDADTATPAAGKAPRRRKEAA